MQIKNKQPRVAIMMATFNGQEYLTEQLESLLRQTYKNWCLFISDDCSTDNTLKILLKYQKKDDRIIKIITNNGNHGAFTNFYNVMRFVKNNWYNQFEYFFYCDQDDIWEENKVEFEVSQIQKYEKKFKKMPLLCYSDLRLIDKKGNYTGEVLSEHSHIKLENPYNIFFSHRYIWGTTMAHNKKLWNLVNIDLYIPNSISHDNYIGKYAAAYGKIIYLDEQLVNYRRHGDNVSGVPQNYNMWSGLKRVFTKLPQILDNHAKTYSATLFFVKNALIKTEFLNELECCLEKGGITARKFVRKYKICTSKNIFNQSAFKIILYTGIYKVEDSFRKENQR